jgi:hypothetical protein
MYLDSTLVELSIPAHREPLREVLGPSF